MVACYPRAIKNLLEQNGLALSGLEVLNFRELTATDIESKLTNDYSFAGGKAVETTIESGLDVPAWYPVVEEPLCIQCGKCFKFCLFGVYTFDNKHLKVVKPLACKNNCPACGRNCPTSAIIFPAAKRTRCAGRRRTRNRSKIERFGCRHQYDLDAEPAFGSAEEYFQGRIDRTG